MVGARTTTVKYSKGHVRHATTSEQVPLGPMLDALRAPPVPPGRDLRVPDGLNAPPSKRSHQETREAPSTTQQSDVTDQKDFAHRAQTAGVPLPRTPEPVVPASETPFQPVPHGNVAPVTPPLSRSDEAMPSTPPFQSFPGGETAPVTSHVENSTFAESEPSSFSVPVRHSVSSAPCTPAVSSTLPADPFDRHVHVPTQMDECDRASAVDTQSDVPVQFDDPFVTAPLILPQRKSGYEPP